MKVNWKKELKPFMEITAACLLSFILALGVVYNIFKPFWDYRKVTFTQRMELTWNTYKNITMQCVHVLFYVIWHVLKGLLMCFKLRFWGAIKYITHEVARALDLLGNVLAGELIEDFVTTLDKTFFGFGEITISAAMGHVKRQAQDDPSVITKFGVFVNNTLNKAFNEEEHSLWSWEREIRDHPLYGQDDYLDNSL